MKIEEVEGGASFEEMSDRREVDGWDTGPSTRGGWPQADLRREPPRRAGSFITRVPPLGEVGGVFLIFFRPLTGAFGWAGAHHPLAYAFGRLWGYQPLLKI